MNTAIMLLTFSFLFMLNSCISACTRISSSVNKDDNVQIFMAPTGIDSNPGTIEKPLKTFQAVLKKISSETKSNKNVIIYLREGIYTLDKTVVIDGTKLETIKSLLIKNYNNEKVKISGGITLKTNLFQSSGEKVLVTDLTSSGIKQVGQLNISGFKDKKQPAGSELFFNDQPMEIARWPNGELLPIDQVIEKGERINYARPDLDPKPKFYYTYSRPNNWKKSNDIWLAGILGVGWSYDNLPISTLNKVTKTIELKQSTSYGVYSSSDTSKSNIRFAKKLRGYYLYNILEELDQPGEYYIDRVNKKLYIWPPSTMKGAIIEMSLLDSPLFSINNAQNISLEGIEYSNSRSNLISVTNSKKITISNSLMVNCGLEAASVKNSSSVLFNKCTIRNTGAGGITLSGGNRKTLTSGNLQVVNCEFSNYSRVYKAYTPAVNLQGVGNMVKNCFIHDAPGQAIYFDGNNHLILNNRIENVCQSFGDIGAIYTGRDPSATGTIIRNNYFYNIGNDLTNMVASVYIDDGSSGIEISNNIFRRSGYNGKDAIGAIHINGGINNQIKNNVFIDCPKLYSSITWTLTRWNNLINKQNMLKVTREIDITSPLYLKRYPYLKNFLEIDKSKEKNYILNTLSYNSERISTGNNLSIENVKNSALSTTTRKATNVPNSYINSSFGLTKERTSQQPSGGEIPSLSQIFPIPNEVKQWKGWSSPDLDNVGIKL